MEFLMNRRRFIQATSTAIVAGALSSTADKASAQPSGELRVLVNGGDMGKANIEAYVKPFEAETGIKVTAITADAPTMTQLELMVQTKNVNIDVVPLPQDRLVEGVAKNVWEKIDYSIFKQEELDGLLDVSKHQFGVAAYAYAWVMVYNTEKYPPGKPRPSSWAEFWSVDKFPGVRLLETGEWGVEGPWEEALLADGVPADQLYPLDIDRAFASLDKIKPHVRKWWGSGSEIQQLMRGQVGDLYQSFDGRAQLLVDNGAPIEINRNQSKLTWIYWAIPNGSPNAENAQKFIEFASRADRQAALAQLIPYGSSNMNSYKHIPEKVAMKLATHPDNISKSITINSQWYAEVGSDGISNQERLRRRWNEWILG
ncbi:ABC transporter substrate-binding protein [Mesorhizobium sp. M2A.F.Ca.ET.040.01.1.1]|nr:ABC transporter substrate-binding protein [Mesorhizobium sp. M2A.F.Ca.ET.040.01.1.1]